MLYFFHKAQQKKTIVIKEFFCVVNISSYQMIFLPKSRNPIGKYPPAEKWRDATLGRSLESRGDRLLVFMRMDRFLPLPKCVSRVMRFWVSQERGTVCIMVQVELLFFGSRQGTSKHYIKRKARLYVSFLKYGSYFLRWRTGVPTTRSHRNYCTPVLRMVWVGEEIRKHDGKYLDIQIISLNIANTI